MFLLNVVVVIKASSLKERKLEVNFGKRVKNAEPKTLNFYTNSHSHNETKNEKKMF